MNNTQGWHVTVHWLGWIGNVEAEDEAAARKLAREKFGAAGTRYMPSNDNKAKVIYEDDSFDITRMPTDEELEDSYQRSIGTP